MLSFLAAILVIVVGVSHCAAYLLWHYERCRSGACGARLSGADVGPWLAEGLALLVAVLTWPLGLASRTRARAGGGRPVVLVNGWGLNRASMALIAARLRRDGRIVHAEPFTWRRKHLADAAASVAERLRAAAAASGSSAVDVVAYGLGGVLV
ncbi:MAG TPA: hypothetical protein VFO62_09075, partial [Candidatus Binatia bacterium]|nr:hypothetical protein [Candidatus Binatia bacterium]